MKDKYKLETWKISKKVWYLFLTVFLMVGACIWIGILIVPDWQVFIDYPPLHQGLIYFLIFVAIGLIFFMLRIVIDTIFSNQRLDDKNKRLAAENIKFDKKISELETELVRLRRE